MCLRTDTELWSHIIAPSGKPHRKRNTTAEVGYAVDTLTQFGDTTVGMKEPTDEIEKAFTREIDTPAATALKKLIENRPLDDPEARAWLQCMVSMSARNPAIGPSDDEANAKLREFVTLLGEIHRVPFEVVNSALAESAAVARSVIPDTRLDASLRQSGVDHLLPEPWVAIPCPAGCTELFTADIPAATTPLNPPGLPTWLAMALCPEVLLTIGYPPPELHDHDSLVRWYNGTLVARVRADPRQRLYTRSDVSPLGVHSG